MHVKKESFINWNHPKHKISKIKSNNCNRFTYEKATKEYSQIETSTLASQRFEKKLGLNFRFVTGYKQFLT